MQRAWIAALAALFLTVPGAVALAHPEAATIGLEGGPDGPVMVAGALRLTFGVGGVALAPASAGPAAVDPSFHLRFEGARAAAPVVTPDGIRYEGVWPGIDLEYRAVAAGPKYELRVAPGASIESIEFAAEGADSVALSSHGGLTTTAGPLSVVDGAPTSWDAEGRPIACFFDLRGVMRYGFACPDWDGTSTLTIDPLLLSTYIGGRDRDEAMAVAYDSQGYPVVVGWTASDDFWNTTNAPDKNASGGDAFVAKFSQDGVQLLWSTCFGGSGFEVGFAVAIDSADRVWFAGETNSLDMFTTANAAQANNSGGMDGFVARLSADGSTIEYATYLGGAGWDRVLAIGLNVNGYPALTGETNSSAFPGMGNGTIHNATGPFDAFLTFVNKVSGVVSSQYIGGNGSDAGRGVGYAPDGSLFLVGSTNSSDLPTNGTGADLTYNGGVDAFVMGYTWQSLTYLGGAGDDYAFALDFSAAGYPIVGGLTASADFPSPGGGFQAASGGSDDGFVAKMSGTGANLTASTFLGGDGSDGVVGLTAAPDGTITAVGFTDSTNFPITPGAMRTILAGTALTSRQDAYFSKLSGDLTALDYSSFMGESGADIARGVVVDGAGVATVVGATDSGGFPTTVGAFDRQSNSTEGFMFRALQRRPNLVISTDPPGRAYQVNSTVFTAASSGPCDEGVLEPISVPSPQGFGTTRYLFDNWSDGGTQNRTFQCLFDMTIEARFHKEVLVSITTTPPGLWLTLNGVNTTAPYSQWWLVGSSFVLEASQQLSRNGTRFLFTGWADGGPSVRTVSTAVPVALEARYLGDAYAVDLLSDPPGRTVAVDGINFTCPAFLWLPIDTAHILEAASPQPDTQGLRWAFANWSNAGSQTHSMTVEAPRTLTASFTPEFQVYIWSNPSEMPFAVDGVEVPSPYVSWRANMTGISIGPPSTVTEIDGVRYGAMTWNDGGPSTRSWLVWRPENLMAEFHEIAYELRLVSDPPGVPLTLEGTAEGAASTFQDSGATVAVGAPFNFTNGSTRYTFLRWSDVGNRSHYVTVTQPVMLTAYFSREFEVRVGATPGDSQFRIDGILYAGTAVLWMEEGSVHQLTAAPTVPAGTGRRLAWIAWGDGEAATHAYTVTAAVLLNLTYRVEVQLTVDSEGGDPTCDVPSCWYPVGADALVSVKSPWNESGGARQVLSGWLGNSSAVNNSAAVSMDGPHTLHVQWRNQFLLSVNSKYSSATGGGWYDEGAGASFRVAADEVTVGGTRYRFTGWSGDLASATQEGLVFMDGPKSVVAVWEEVHAEPAEAPYWLLVPLIAAAAAGAAIVAARRKKAARQAERAWKAGDEWKPVEQELEK